MATPESTVIVVTDANVLINFYHIGQLTLLGALPPYRFTVPQDVIDEIVEEQQRAAVELAIQAGHLQRFVASRSCYSPELETALYVLIMALDKNWLDEFLKEKPWRDLVFRGGVWLFISSIHVFASSYPWPAPTSARTDHD